MGNTSLKHNGHKNSLKEIFVEYRLTWALHKGGATSEALHQGFNVHISYKQYPADEICHILLY